MRRQAAAIVCGLLLLQGSHALSAAEKSSKKQTVEKRAASAKSGVKSAPKGAGSAGAAFGFAEVIDPPVGGLHGSASFYGPGFHGRRTASGDVFDQQTFSGASNRFPLGSWVAVRRLDTNRCAIVKINDRMHARHVRRIIDVSRAVADYLDMVRAGVILVRVAPLKSGERHDRACLASFSVDDDSENLPPLHEPWRPKPPTDAHFDAMQ